MLWFRAIWYVTNQKNGASALGVQRLLGLGSYKTAWALLHKLRRAMVRPGRDRLQGVVEVDEASWGWEEKAGYSHYRALIAVAAEVDGKGIGRVRLRCIRSPTKFILQSFVSQTVQPGSTIWTDGSAAYRGLPGYEHQYQIQQEQPKGESVLPRVHRVVSLLKRWLLGTHQGAVENDYLDYYLDEFAFRFNRRKSASRGKLFFRLCQQAVQINPVPVEILSKHHP